MSRPGGNVTVQENVGASRFEVFVDGGQVGLAEYRISAGRMVFTHTEVQPEFQGRGLAATLVETALDTARSRGLIVVPLCSYVAHYIREHPEYSELLASS